MQWSRQGEGRIPGAMRHGWRRFWNPAWLSRIGKDRTQGSSFLGSRLGRLPHAGTWMVLIWVILLCLPIAGMVLGYIRRPGAGTSGISTGTSPFDGGTDAAEKKPKPSAGRPMLPVSQAPPPTITSPTPAPIEPVTPPPIATPSRPAAPGTAPTPAPVAPTAPIAPSGARPGFAAVSYPARHEKHFGAECSGQLTLNGSGLYFNCPDSADSVNVAINEIDAVDDNGIRLLSGKKYHFTISGMSRGDARTLFADWLSRVR